MERGAGKSDRETGKFGLCSVMRTREHNVRRRTRGLPSHAVERARKIESLTRIENRFSGVGGLEVRAVCLKGYPDSENKSGVCKQLLPV